MKLFGDKSEFAIEYGHITELLAEPYPGHPEINDEFDYWVSFWVKGKNLFLKHPVKGCMVDTYVYDINLLIEFFSQGLSFQLKFDPVPAKGIRARNHNDANILARLAYFFDKEDYDELSEEDSNFLEWIEFNLHSIKLDEDNKHIDWEYHHQLSTARQASFLPNVTIARHYTDSKKIEICNDSEGLTFTSQSYKKFSFVHTMSVDLVDIKLYKQVIVDFCLDFISQHKEKHPKRMNEYLEKLKIGMAIEV